MITFLLIVGALLVGYFFGRMSTPPGPVRYVRVETASADTSAPAIGKSARAAAELIHEVVALAERLTVHNIVVMELECMYAAFGCWRLQAENGTEMDRDWKARGEVVEVFWDGMEYVLSAKSSPRESGLAPNAWKVELDRRLGRDGDAIGAAEQFLMNRLVSARTTPT